MKAVIYFIISVIFWGLNFHLAKILLSEVNFIEAGFWRYLFGILPLTLLVYKDMPSLELILKNLKGISLVGIIGIFGFNLFFFLGMMHTTAINAVLIFSLNPALTLLLSNRILKTPLHWKHIIGIIVSFIGVAYLLAQGNIGNLFTIHFTNGDILIFIANVFFALHHVWVKKYASAISNSNFTFLTGILCLACFLLFLPFYGMEDITTHGISFWLSVIGIGFFGTSLTYYLWNKGIKLTGANQAGIFINIIPLSTAIFAAFFGEVLYFYHAISGLLIVFGVFVMKTNMLKTIKI